jgi:UDP-N-acetylmuramyl tripeptide synthase
VAALADQTAAQVSYYGVAAALRPSFPTDEELYGGPLRISDVPAAAELLALPGAGSPLTAIRLDGRRCEVLLRADGPHNAQNATAAAALAGTFGFDADTIVAGLAKVSPAFGRGQSFTVDGRRVVLQLVKNPAGFRQTLHTLDGRPSADAIVITINDDYADGRDVSWLWDVDFAALAGPPSPGPTPDRPVSESTPTGRSTRLSTSGTRAADMALRLHYDEVAVTETEPDLEKALRSALAAVPERGTVIVFSTYTAMWALHAILQRIGEPVT